MVLGTTATTQISDSGETVHFIHLRRGLKPESTSMHFFSYRPIQYKLLSVVNPRFAIVYGEEKSGKTMALELGLGFFMGRKERGEEKDEKRIVKRILISNNCEEGNVQDVVREETFKNTDDGKFYHIRDPGKIIEVVRREKKFDVQLTEEGCES